MKHMTRSILGLAGLLSISTLLTAYTGFSEDPICEKPDEMPEFPGEKDAIYKFLGLNLKYPYDDKMNGVQGFIMAQFVVEKDGSLTQVETVDEKKTYGSQEMKDEAIRVVKLMPKWIPGTLKEEPVRVRYKMPIRFALSNGKKKKRSK